MANGPHTRLRLGDLTRITEWQHEIDWQPMREGVDIHWLYGDGVGPRAALLRYHPGGRMPLHEHTGYEHILVLAGTQTDEQGESATGSLTISPPGTRHSVVSHEGCIVLAIHEEAVRFIETDARPET